MIALSPVVDVRLYHGRRADIRSLFEQADDSPRQIDTYLDAGEVLVAYSQDQIAGHVQLIGAGTDWEVKSIAVVEGQRGRGIGTTLIRAAVSRACAAGARRVWVATATADIRNVRFYQRRGFRMDRIDRDVFIADRGYPDLEVDGISVRDRVWFVLNCDDWR